MKTIFASLPFYDSTDKQDINRVNSTIPFYCPQNELPSFLINCESDTIATVAVYLVSCTGAETDITDYLPSSPYEVTVGSDTYIQYDGGIVLTELPKGNYYVKVDNGRDKYYYSEQLRISNVYPNLITGWTNDSYETLTTSGTSITSAVESTVSGKCISSDSFSINKGESISLKTNFTLISGVAPWVTLVTAVDGAQKANEVFLDSSGTKDITLTATETMTAAYVRFENDEDGNWSTSDVFVTILHSQYFTRLAFSNTNDLGDILYSTIFEQKVWLNTGLNTPEHEVVEVGEEKDGQFIAEKIVTKWRYKIVAYVSPALYRVLLRLPQHDTIEITDEVGNVYTPSVGNVQILSADWVTFDTVRLAIRFNDGDNTAFSWTYGMTNLI